MLQGWMVLLTVAVYRMTVQEVKSMGDLANIGYSLGSQNTRGVQDKGCKDQHFRIPPPIKSKSSTDAEMTYKAPVLTKDETYSAKKDGAAMIIFPTPWTKGELVNIAAATKNGAALTGSAAMGQVGPIVGLMDISECEDSYPFRVSLPGVKRYESKFLIST